MQGDKLWHNGAFMHAACAAEHERLILGDDAGPGLAEHLDYVDALQTFLAKLGTEAAILGIDRQKLAFAIRRAADA
jgi:hypothetical protein